MSQASTTTALRKTYEMKPHFFNFLYHAALEKLNESEFDPEYTDSRQIINVKHPDFWGDFFEQVLGLDRDQVLKETWADLSQFFAADCDASDPVITNILYHAKLTDLFGHEELEFSEIYPLPKE